MELIESSRCNILRSLTRFIASQKSKKLTSTWRSERHLKSTMLSKRPEVILQLLHKSQRALELRHSHSERLSCRKVRMVALKWTWLRAQTSNRLKFHLHKALFQTHVSLAPPSISILVWTQLIPTQRSQIHSCRRWERSRNALDLFNQMKNQHICSLRKRTLHLSALVFHPALRPYTLFQTIARGLQPLSSHFITLLSGTTWSTLSSTLFKMRNRANSLSTSSASSYSNVAHQT